MDGRAVTYLIYSPPRPSYPGIVHLSTDGVVEDCITQRRVGPRESGGQVGDPKAEDLLAGRLASGGYRKCRKCWRYGARYRGG